MSKGIQFISRNGQMYFTTYFSKYNNRLILTIITYNRREMCVYERYNVSMNVGFRINKG